MLMHDLLVIIPALSERILMQQHAVVASTCQSIDAPHALDP